MSVDFEIRKALSADPEYAAAVEQSDQLRMKADQAKRRVLVSLIPTGEIFPLD